MSLKLKQKITLDFTVSRIQNIHCSQDDCDSRNILITLSDNGKPYRLSQSDILCIKISKPDHTFVYIDDDDAHVSRNDDGTISLILPEQATCVPGKCDAELKIISENSTVTTACFHIIVRKSVLEDNEIESAVESNIIEKMVRHLADESNPHKTDKVQVGLGNVPNVTTNDQTPTYTESSALSTLSSGETLGTAFGKIAKAIHTFIEHLTEHASVLSYGHTRLVDSVTSTSTDASATPNSVKTAYDKAADVANDLSRHNLSEEAHADLRDFMETLSSRLSAVADSDDETLDQLSEIVAYIKNNKSLIDSITTAKINVTDIVDNLTSAAADKPLSARQGKALRDLIDTAVNADVSGVKGDAEDAYRTGYVNLTPANIGLANVANERQYSASNPQPSVAGSSGSCTGNAATATRATQDGNGHNIANTYLPKSDIGSNYSTSLTTSKSIPNDVSTEILTITIGVTGTYLIHAQATFSSNKNGLRRLDLKDTNTTGGFGGIQVGASGSGTTVLQVSSVSALGLAAGQKVRLYARQNCGAALNINSVYLNAIRIK